MVCDAFSKDCELSLNFLTEETALDTDIKVYSERVTGLCATKAKLDYTCAFLAATLPSVEFARTADGVEGSVTSTLLYEQAGEVHSTEVNMPFSCPLTGLSANCREISVAVCGVSLRQRAEGECEGEAVLKITGADGEVKTVKYLNEITEQGEKTVPDCAISVYIPSAGDGLWERRNGFRKRPKVSKNQTPNFLSL